MALFPDREPLRFRLGAAYFLGAVLCAVAGHWILWWPVIRFGYRFGHLLDRPAGAFLENESPVSVILAPYLAGGVAQHALADTTPKARA